MYRLVQKCLAVATAIVFALLLAACTISSDVKLVGDDEGVTPLPDHFVLYPYESSTDGFVPSADKPTTFIRDGKQYVSVEMPDTKRPIRLSLVPTSADSYLLVAILDDEPNFAYGFARYNDGVLALELSPDKDTSAAIAQLRKTGMPKDRKPLAGLKVDAQTDAITVSTRAALDELAELFAAGRLPMDEPVLAFVAEAPDTPRPSRLVRSGSDWIKVP